jgi:hypothetical protein
MAANEWPARVFDEGAPTGGASGLLIDQQTVLTCAHVVDMMKHPRVSFPARRELGSLPVVAEISKQWRRGGDNSADVAVLRLAQPVPIRPARFASRNALSFALQDLVVIGFPIAAGEGGRIASVTATTAQMLLQGEWVQLESLKEFGPNVGKGYSGGAVALRSTLEVVGIVTAADKVERLGLMLPLTKLVEYRADLLDLLPLGPIDPSGHRMLRALLTGLPVTNAAWVYRCAVGDELLPDLPDSGRLSDRDTAYGIARYIAEELLFDDQEGSAVRSALARLCHQLADETADPVLTDSLRDWAGKHSTRTVRYGQYSPPQPKVTSRVSVQVRRSAAGAQSMLLEVSVQSAGGREEHVVSERVKTSQVQNAVQELLPRVINDHIPSGGSVMVEFVLPRGWLSRPVEEWTLGHRGAVQIGWRHPVVVRDLARFEIRHNDRELGRRWATLIDPAADAAVVYWVRCRDIAMSRQIAASLALDSQRAILALVNPPAPVASDHVLRAGFDSGMPAMLWRRSRCQDHEDADSPVPCEGERFESDISAELTGFLAQTPIYELPELVRRLRVTAGECPDHQPHHGRGLTLMWDPPEPANRASRLALANTGGGL